MAFDKTIQKNSTFIAFKILESAGFFFSFVFYFTQCTLNFCYRCYFFGLKQNLRFFYYKMKNGACTICHRRAHIRCKFVIANYCDRENAS
jgi:hypothetical protein